MTRNYVRSSFSQEVLSMTRNYVRSSFSQEVLSMTNLLLLSPRLVEVVGAIRIVPGACSDRRCSA